MPDPYRDIKHLIQSSAFSQALSLADAALAKAPRDVEILYLKTVTLRLMQKHTEAISTLNLILAVQPAHARAHQEAGYCYLALNNIETAKQAFHYACMANPALVSAWKKLLELDPNNTEAAERVNDLSSLNKKLLAAMDLMYEGKYALAETICREYLQSDTHNPDAMCLLAEIGIKTKVYDDAVFLLETCVELHPHYQPAKLKYADLLNTLGQHNKALQVAKEYLQQLPNNLVAQTTLAAAYMGVGDLDKSLAIYDAILAIEPKRAGIHLQKGHALKAKGAFEDAVASYKAAYGLKPSYGDAYWSLANTKTYRFSEDEINTIKQFADQDENRSLDRVHFCFALGKAYEDTQEYALSFDYYAKGNALKNSMLGYSAETNTKLVNLQIQHCNTDLFSQRASGNPTCAPIFIVGLPRAGSTLLEQILSSHSSVDATMELHSILGMAMRLRGRMTNDTPAYPANLHALSDQQFAQLGDKFIEDTQPYRQGAPLFIDKMPNNFMHIGLIKCILPNAKVIDARREPMACCFSGFKQLFGEGQEFSYDLKNMAAYYNDYVRLMAHWDKVLPGFVLRVNHEEVINDLEGQVRRMLAFCDLPFEQACLDFHKNKRAIKTPSSEQVRKPISREGMQQWKHYKAFLQPLIDALD
ncbi:sulfotransferase family protein [Alteromonas sediminis]|uniref:Sulfotransferase family protein n=1 Tax=Alteromonas sediminis TaxID=2259342 RepID=A0A3N5Y0M3_9ALTE|nr:tetratricopeptide repeat-containing sulfotransferase family protein [Alteromonas sediminis]RPJ67022.1 sulfotransferase family protein [Alteromonas sediminis]